MITPSSSFFSFEFERQHFSSPNCPTLPHGLGPPSTLPKEPSPSELMRYLWYIPDRPYLGFILQCPYRGDLLSSLSTPPEAISLENHEQGFHLTRDRGKAWRSLEASVVACCKALRTFYNVEHPKNSLNVTPPDCPSVYKYLKSHSSEEKALNAIRATLDAFAMLTAYLSYLLAICQYGIPPSSDEPSWMSYLKQNKCAHPEWLALLLKSPLVDFRLQRRGAIVDVARHSCNRVEYLMQASVPLWLYWGASPLTLTPQASWISNYRPLMSTPASTTPAPLSVISSNFPAVIPSSGQKLGETMTQYFARQREKRASTKETDRHREIRQQRESVAATRSRPGKKGASVFRWEMVDGFRIRRLLTRAEVANLWDCFSDRGLVFDSYKNCWDYCSDFGEDDFCPDEEMDSDSEDERMFPNMRPVCGASTSTHQAPLSGHPSNPPPLPPTVIVRPLNPTPATPPARQRTPPSNPTPATPPAPIRQRTPTLLPLQVIPSSTSLPSGPGSRSDEEMDSDSEDARMFPNMRPVCGASTSTHQAPLSGHPSNPPPLPPAVIVRPLNPTPATPPARQRTPPSDTTPATPPAPNRQRTPTLLPLQVIPSTSLPSGQGSHSESRQETRLSLPSLPGKRLSVFNDPLRMHPPSDSDSYTIESESNNEADEGPMDFYEASVGSVIHAHSFQPVHFASANSQTIEDLLYFRFGFTLLEEPYTGCSQSIRRISFSNWLEVCGAIGGKDLMCSPARRTAITDFLSCLLASGDPLSLVPGKFWDLSLHGANSINLGDSGSTIRIKPWVVGGDKVFLLESLDPNPGRTVPWHITVNAMTALEAVRRQLGPHPEDIAIFFAHHGITFSLYIPLPSKVSLPSRRAKPSSKMSIPLLGSRRFGHKFDLADYASYLARRDLFLRTEPCARAALSMGGIVARLAREVLSVDLSAEGPSPQACQGEGAVVSSADMYFGKDVLSDECLDLICGVYSLDSRPGHKRDAPAQVSWFPRHAKWFDSGFSVGQWTHECELWFQSRIEDIQNGSYPYAQNDWRQKIRKNRQSTKLTHNMDIAAAAYIDQHGAMGSP